MKNLLILIIIFSLNLDLFKPKKFPELEHYTVDRKLITNDYFKENEKTLVVHGFIGCEAAMKVLQDLQQFEKQRKKIPQVLLIFENSLIQFNSFNDTIQRPLSDLRKFYDLNPITFDVIVECETTKVHSKNGTIEIGSECRKLGKKLKTKSSPTLLLVNADGEITKKIKGYNTKQNWLFEFINQ
ncbi:MAG: hypothetical protein AB8G11_03350 [Saprospiraceae bacterium]